MWNITELKCVLGRDTLGSIAPLIKKNTGDQCPYDSLDVRMRTEGEELRWCSK